MSLVSEDAIDTYIRSLGPGDRGYRPQIMDLAFNLYGWAIEDGIGSKKNKIVINARAPSRSSYESVLEAAEEHSTPPSEIFNSSPNFSTAEGAQPSQDTCQYMLICRLRPNNVIPWDSAAPPVLVVAQLACKKSTHYARYLALLKPKDGLCTPFYISERQHVFFRWEFRYLVTNFGRRRAFWASAVKEGLETLSYRKLHNSKAKEKKKGEAKEASADAIEATLLAEGDDDELDTHQSSTPPNEDETLLLRTQPELEAAATVGAARHPEAVQESTEAETTASVESSESRTASAPQAEVAASPNPIDSGFEIIAEQLKVLAHKVVKQREETLAAEKEAWKLEKRQQEEKLAAEKEFWARENRQQQEKLSVAKSSWEIMKLAGENDLAGRKKKLLVEGKRVQRIQAETVAREKKFDQSKANLEKDKIKMEMEMKTREKKVEELQASLERERGEIFISGLRNGLKRFRELGDDMERDLKKTKVG